MLLDLVQIWCNTLCDDTHDIHDIARKHTINLRYFTLFTISNNVAKTRRDNFDFVEYKKCSALAGHFLLSLREQL